MTRVVISLTTIPPRLPKIGRTLQDLLSQRADVEAVRLNLPRSYRRFDFDPDNLPLLPDGVQVVICDQDYGPATKVLPTLRDYAGQDVEVLFCDDDQAYDPDWVGRFLKIRAERPNDCLVEAGYNIAERRADLGAPAPSSFQPRLPRRKKGLAYRAVRLATLGRVQPNGLSGPGYVDILEGYGGVMLRPSMMPEAAFDIPDILWTVDDPWLSGHLTVNGVGIWRQVHRDWRLPSGRAWGKAYANDRVHALKRMVYKETGRQDADALSINYFRQTYGIWLPDA